MTKKTHKFSVLVNKLSPQVDSVDVNHYRKNKLLNTKHKEQNIENIEYTIHLFFDDNIMSKIVDNTKNRINETIFRLQRVQSRKKSVDKYPNAQITMPFMW